MTISQGFLSLKHVNMQKTTCALYLEEYIKLKQHIYICLVYIAVYCRVYEEQRRQQKPHDTVPREIQYWEDLFAIWISNIQKRSSIL